jgi:3-deoxy-D-manno-octulosonate 8-phosphate phosphatase (KDO 8-P phosphatase)
MRFNIDKSIVYKAASKITLLALDVDGVLTDGRIYFSKTGEEIKTFHTLDGQGIKMLHACSIEVAIITGRSSMILEKRAADLSAIRNVGLSFSVPNGHPEIRAASHAITTAEGGMGAVREITDFLLKANRKYDSFYQ